MTLTKRRTEEAVEYEYVPGDVDKLKGTIAGSLLGELLDNGEHVSILAHWEKKLDEKGLGKVRVYSNKSDVTQRMGYSVVWYEVIRNPHTDNETRQMAPDGMVLNANEIKRRIRIQTDCTGILDDGLMATIIMMLPPGATDD